ncbi:MAG: CDP-alcohol phosphatidyltransferase family protein [Gemmatimonadota bacterium]
MKNGTFLSIPNVLSLSRVGLAAAFVFNVQPGVRVSLIVAAALTDFLDGWLARRSRSQTRWGALLDPITDRMFVLCAVCVLLIERRITTTDYFVIISRDLMTAVGFIVAKLVTTLRPVEFRARLAGKLATSFQLAALVAIVLQHSLAGPLLIALALTSVVAIIDYTWLLWREREREGAGAGT